MCWFSTVIANCIADSIEEVIVTSSLIDATTDMVSNPLHIVRGESISTDATGSIGASIGDLTGLSYRDYGAAVGQPIIRGMSGNRVQVLINGMVNRDVSGLGDHINDIDLNNVQQIEVIKGPSSTYSNGTVGGVVNVVDNIIAKKDFAASTALGVERQSVNNGDTYNFAYQSNIGELNLSLAYKDTQLGNFDIPMAPLSTMMRSTLVKIMQARKSTKKI